MANMRIRNSNTGKIRTYVGSHTLGPDEEFESTWMWDRAREALSGLPVRVKLMYPAQGAHNWKVVLDVAEGLETPPSSLKVEIEERVQLRVRVKMDDLPDDDLRQYLKIEEFNRPDDSEDEVIKLKEKKLKVSLDYEKIMGLLAEATGLVPVISRGSTFLDYPACQDGSV